MFSMNCIAVKLREFVQVFFVNGLFRKGIPYLCSSIPFFNSQPFFLGMHSKCQKQNGRCHHLPFCLSLFSVH